MGKSYQDSGWQEDSVVLNISLWSQAPIYCPLKKRVVVELILLYLSNEQCEPGDWSWTATSTPFVGACSCLQPSTKKAADTSCFPAWWVAWRPISDTQIKWRRGHTGDQMKWPELQQRFCKVNELIHGSTKHKRTYRILASRFAPVVVMDFNCSYRPVTEVLRWISLKWMLYFI